MFSIFRKIFKPTGAQPAPASKPATPPPAAPAPVRRAPAAESAAGAAPSVEVAHLSLAAIVGRFPPELQALVLAPPSSAATISFPVQLIQKQLASGSVKMSLASLHRQAPPGVFGPLAPGEKRQVEIPLKEVFRHVNPQTLKRRNDQRSMDTPDDEFNLFGNAENPHQIAPTGPREDSTPIGSPQPASRIPASVVAPQPPAPERMVNLPAPTAMRVVAPPPAMARPAAPAPVAPPPSVAAVKPAAEVPLPDLPSLTLPLSSFAAGWPEAIRAEIAALDPATTVTLNGGAVSVGLSKGKVIFTWRDICAGLQPAPAQPTAIDENLELVLPLKIVAPAFLAAGKSGQSERKSVQIDDAIPSLFSSGRQPATEPAPPAPAAVVPEPPAHVPAPPLPAVSSPAMGEIFGEPDRTDFTPAAIVAGTVKLPGVAGAVVAMNDGLPVAAALPDGVKSEVVAAFLPQIFARLNQYAGEMKLGDVDDLLFTTHGAQCQIYRLGAVYFAALGQPGAVLPARELRLIAAELGRQIR